MGSAVAEEDGSDVGPTCQQERTAERADELTSRVRGTVREGNARAKGVGAD
jgi:hypothetical protein